MHIESDDLSRPAVQALLQEHLDNMHAITPAAHVHALDLDGLRAQGISFWTVWDGTQLLGCGALRELSPKHGEVKSMRTPAALRRRGAGRIVLAHIVQTARSRGYRLLSLETGSHPAFHPAHRLYQSAGFKMCEAFEPYAPSPTSVFMSLDLTA